jgi:hypothetical protein
VIKRNVCLGLQHQTQLMRNLCLLIALAVLASGNVFAKNNQWTNLFNGKDLSGWKQLNGNAPFEFKNGELIGTSVSNQPNSFLVSEKQYGDFILEVEYFIDPYLNSGIQFRSLSLPEYQNGRVHGYQFELDPSSRAWSGGIYDEGRREWLYTLEYNTEAKSAFKPNAWNKARIECIGSRIRTFLNGIPTAYIIDDLTLQGFIAFQVHSIYRPEDEGKKIRWRNARIQTQNLTESPNSSIFVANFLANNLSSQEKENGYALLWDGKSTAGWRGAYKENFPTKGWKIEEGILHVLPSDGGESTHGGDIVTIKKYGAFDLQFQFKLTEGANSGIKYFVTESEGNSGSAIGLEYQLLDNEKHPDAKQGAAGNRTLASLYDLIPADNISRAIKPIGEWNLGRIVVYPDNRVEHYLNGYKVVEYKRGSALFQALVARSKYAGWKNFGLAKEGHILIQDHGDAVSFRSIKIKAL